MPFSDFHPASVREATFAVRCILNSREIAYDRAEVLAYVAPRRFLWDAPHALADAFVSDSGADGCDL